MSILDRIVTGVLDIVEEVIAGKPATANDTHHEGDPPKPDETPARKLYNRALTHPATTIGLITAAVGVTAAVAFALAERRAQRGIDQEIARKGRRFGQRLRHWSEEEVSPRLGKYSHKYGRRASRWAKRRSFWD